MSTIPEAAVEAARQAFGKHAEWRYRQNWNARGTCICGETLPEKGNIHREFGYHQMTKVLEAAMPHIEAQLRVQIAREIRLGISEYQEQLIEEAARIAERSGE